jgi:hypothetical protein
MPRFSRYLRIAFSATCLIACALLIVLWVRSHFVIEGIAHRSSGPAAISRTFVAINNGTFQVTHVHRETPASDHFPEGWSYETTTWDDATYSFFDWGFFPGGFLLQFPIPLPALCVAVVAWVIPWNRIKFSLRTLLFATTLIAVVLGAVVWATRERPAARVALWAGLVDTFGGPPQTARGARIRKALKNQWG